MLSRVRLTALSASAVVLLGAPAPSRAHGPAAGPPEIPSVFFAWTLEPLVLASLAVAAVAYLGAVLRVNAAHPRTPVRRLRTLAWMVGLALVAIALLSPIDTYADSLFSVHMVQHLLLSMVAAPLLAIGAPITLLLRLARPDIRRRLILPVLHSRPVKVLSFPPVSWVLFAAVMWASHFSPLFDAALEDHGVHALEHVLYLTSAMLFWWPVVGADPSPWRLSHPMRIGYLMLGVPQSAFLGLAILSAPDVLYRHYATLERTWGPSPLADQQLAGGIMWAAGDILFFIPFLLAVAVWFRAEEQKGAQLDAQLDRRRAAERAGAGQR